MENVEQSQGDKRESCTVSVDVTVKKAVKIAYFWWRPWKIIFIFYAYFLVAECR
jgi:hypothetical protein